jgi:hypothetical protein
VNQFAGAAVVGVDVVDDCSHLVDRGSGLARNRRAARALARMAERG